MIGQTTQHNRYNIAWLWPKGGFQLCHLLIV